MFFASKVLVCLFFSGPRFINSCLITPCNSPVHRCWHTVRWLSLYSCCANRSTNWGLSIDGEIHRTMSREHPFTHTFPDFLLQVVNALPHKWSSYEYRFAARYGPSVLKLRMNSLSCFSRSCAPIASSPNIAFSFGAKFVASSSSPYYLQQMITCSTLRSKLLQRFPQFFESSWSNTQ